MHYLFYFALLKLDAAIRYSLLKDDIIDFPYFFINVNFFRFSSRVVAFVFKLMKYFNAILLSMAQ